MMLRPPTEKEEEEKEEKNEKARMRGKATRTEPKQER